PAEVAGAAADRPEARPIPSPRGEPTERAERAPGARRCPAHDRRAGVHPGQLASPGDHRPDPGAPRGHRGRARGAAPPAQARAALLARAGPDPPAPRRATRGCVRGVAAIGAYGVGAWGGRAAGSLSWTASGPDAAARAAALLLLASAFALTAAWQGAGTGRST